MRTFAVLAVVTMLFPAYGEAQERAQTQSSCVVRSASYVVQRGDPKFSKTAGDLNAFFVGSKSAGGVSVPSAQGLFASDKTEFIWVETDVSSCSSGGKSGVGISGIGGCEYLGCTGSLPSEFDSLPNGSVVSLSSCGGGMQTSGTFKKQSNGTWKMTAYRTEYVTQCDPLG